MKETDAKILTSAEPTHTNHDVSEILVSETISMFFLSPLSPRCYKPNTRTRWFTLTGLGSQCQDGQIHIQILKKKMKNGRAILLWYIISSWNISYLKYLWNIALYFQYISFVWTILVRTQMPIYMRRNGFMLRCGKSDPLLLNTGKMCDK